MPPDPEVVHVVENGDGAALAALLESADDEGAAVQALMESAGADPERLFTLATAWEEHFRASGSAAALDWALLLQERCAELIGSDHPAFPTVMRSIGLLSRFRFFRRGDRSDLEHAVETLQAAYDAWDGDDDAERAYLASTLGTALQDRYESTYQGDDLDRAITLHQSSIELDPGRPGYAANLGNALRLRFERTRDPADLARSIAHQERLVEETPEGVSPRVRNHFALALEQRDEDGDLDRAIEQFRAALADLREGSEDRTVFSHNLGRALWTRYKRRADGADLDAAAQAMEAVLDAERPLHPELLWSTAFVLLESLDLETPELEAGNARAATAVRAFDRALEAFPSEGADHDRLTSGRRRALGRSSRPAMSPAYRLDGRVANVITGVHHGRTRKVISIAPVHGAIMLGIGEDPTTGRFAATMNHVERAYPDGDEYSTWIFLSGPDTVLRYHAHEHADDEWLALDALRSTAVPPTLHGPFTLSGGSMRAVLATAFFAGAERHVCLFGGDADEWLAEDDPLDLSMRFFTVLSAVLAAAPTVRVAVVHGMIVQFMADLTGPMPPRELAEQLLAQAGIGEAPSAGPFDAEGFDDAGGDAMTWHLEGMRLITAYEQLGNPGPLAAGVTSLRNAVTAVPSGHSHRPVHLRNLALALDMLFQATGDPGALAEAATAWRQAGDGPGAEWGDGLSLGVTLRTLGEFTGDGEVLDEAISVLRDTAGRAPLGTPDEAEALDHLSMALGFRAETTRDPTPAAEAVQASRRAAAHPDWHGRLERLAYALKLSAQLNSDPSPLDESIELYRAIVADLAQDDPRLAASLHNVGGALWVRAELTGTPDDFTEALGLFRRAVGTQTDDDPNGAIQLSTLAAALAQRHDETGNRAVLDEALGFQRSAISRTHPTAAVHGKWLLALSQMLDRRYSRSGAVSLLHENIEAARTYREARPGDVRGGSLLGGLLSERFERLGDPADLVEAIAVLREAADGTRDSAALGGVLNNLAVTLSRRYAASGDVTALREAIELERRVVTLLPGDPGPLMNLGDFARTLAVRTDDPTLLQEAVAVGRQALAADPTEIMDKVGALTNLGLSLREWAVRADEEALAEEASVLLRQAADLTPPDYHDRARYLANLGVVGDTDDRTLDTAVAAIRRALETTPYGAVRAQRMMNLVGHLGRQHERRPDPALLTEAAGLAKAAAGVDTAAPLVRVQAAHVWATEAAERGDWTEAVRAFTLGVGLLPMVAPRDLTRADQEHGLTDLGSLASDGAACALRAGDPERALVLLEQGRGVLLGQAMDDRSDLVRLRRRSPELADRFERLRDGLGDVGQDSDRARLALEWTRLIDEIRAAPEWAGFHSPPTVDRLLPQAGPGTIVLVNVSRYGSSALLLSVGGISVVPLPELTPAALAQQIDAFWTRRRAAEDVSDVLAWLWDAVAGPVLNALEITGPPARGGRWPRIWWSAGGPLALLPLHAAGHHRERADHRTVLDRAISSYTPTVRALEHARRRDRRGRADGRDVLVVSLPEVAGRAPLPGVRKETDLLAGRFPRATVLAGVEATHDRVLAELGAHEIAHFACHATADPAHPSEGRLVLWDHAERPLSVLELSRRDLGRARLAYLSACETAAVSPALADEALHITAACQLAGFPHVIGTLWPIGDRFATRVAGEVYAALARRGRLVVGRAPAALHEVVRRARDEHPGRVWHWGAYVHFGP